jgi:cell division septum initiation protein DivIVA
MKAMMMMLALAIGLLLAANVSSDTIYTWTDESGVQRFSSDSPPEGVDNYQQIESEAVPPDRTKGGDRRRPSYDRMVQQASQEARQLEQQRKAEAAARAAEEKRIAKERRQAKIQAERSRLLQQIEAIKNRAVSPTYPLGMKQAQIDKIRKQIDALEKNPDTVASPRQ